MSSRVLYRDDGMQEADTGQLLQEVRGEAGLDGADPITEPDLQVLVEDDLQVGGK